MASGARPVSLALAALVAGLVIGPVLALVPRGGGLSAADLSALRFTLLQAAVSALLSALGGALLARALFRRRFPGRRAFLVALGAPFLLPVIVAVMALVTVWGRAGWLNAALGALGLPALTIYGPAGVILAHVFLNLPLATRMILQGWSAIPAERFRLAASLGLPPRALFRRIELPMLRAELPGVLVTVFLICLTSFAVALVMGGGPRATTLELAIYQALRFEADLGHAATLALVQLALGLGGTLAAAALTRPVAFGAGLDRSLALAAPGGLALLADGLVIVLGAAFLIAPLLAVVTAGLPGLAALPAQVWPAAGLSLALGLGAALLATGTALALVLAVAARAPLSPAVEGASMLPLSASGLVLATGAFLLLRPIFGAEALALPVTLIANALAGLPFAFRLLLPMARQTEADFARLADSLALTRRQRLRHVDLPRLARPLGLAMGLTMALSMGDLGAIALLAGDGTATLPLVIQRLYGAYRIEAASGAALVLVVLSFLSFAVFDLWGRARAAD